MKMQENKVMLNRDQIYYLLADAARDAILIVRKSDRKIVWTNDACVRIYGFSNDEFLSMYMDDLRAIGKREMLFGDMEDTSDCGKLFETIHRGKDGTLLPVEVNVANAISEKKEIFVCLIRDLRDRKEVQRELVKVIDQKCRSAGRKIYEGLSQSLLGILFLVQSLGYSFKTGATDLESQFELIEERIHGLIVESKTLALYLTLVASGEEGLVAGLIALAESIERIYSPRCEVHCAKSVRIKSDEFAQHLYNVAQEASRILILNDPGDLIEFDLKTRDSMIVMEIRDNSASTGKIKYADMVVRMIDMRACLFGGYVTYQEKDSRRIITCYMSPELDVMEA
jgi:PAS domain S-box-containing protein